MKDLDEHILTVLFMLLLEEVRFLPFLLEGGGEVFFLTMAHKGHAANKRIAANKKESLQIKKNRCK